MTKSHGLDRREWHFGSIAEAASWYEAAGLHLKAQRREPRELDPHQFDWERRPELSFAALPTAYPLHSTPALAATPPSITHEMRVAPTTEPDSWLQVSRL